MHAIGALAQHLRPDCAGMMEGWGAEVRAVREPPLRGRGMVRMDVALGRAGSKTCPYGERDGSTARRTFGLPTQL